MLLIPVRWCLRASTTLQPALEEPSGVPEVSSGIPSPPDSPPLAAYATSHSKLMGPVTSTQARRGDIAYTIAEECERLFCGTLKSVFLGEGSTIAQDPLAVGVHHYDSNSSSFTNHGLQTPLSSSPDAMMKESRGLAKQWVEIYDYIGGTRFRGFAAEGKESRTLFIFFEEDVVGMDLKPGLMALLELCSAPEFDCSQLTVCLDRQTEPHSLKALTRDLGWVGFEPSTLLDWTSGDNIISDMWFFMSMDV